MVCELWDRVDGRVFVQIPWTRRQFTEKGKAFTENALQHSMDTSYHTCTQDLSSYWLPERNSPKGIEEYVDKYFEEHVESVGWLELIRECFCKSVQVIVFRVRTAPGSVRFAITLINILAFCFMRKEKGMHCDEFMKCASNMPAEFASEAHRLFTAMFLHGGLCHLLLNILGLMQMGGLEEHLGCSRFAVLYLAAGLWANLIACGIRVLLGVPKCSLGASGAVYGLYGADMAQGLIMWRVLNSHWRRVFIKILSVFVFVCCTEACFIGEILQANIDHHAHAAGFLAGFALACLLHRKDVCHLQSWITTIASAVLMIGVCASCAIIFAWSMPLYRCGFLARQFK